MNMHSLQANTFLNCSSHMWDGQKCLDRYRRMFCQFRVLKLVMAFGLVVDSSTLHAQFIPTSKAPLAVPFDTPGQFQSVFRLMNPGLGSGNLTQSVDGGITGGALGVSPTATPAEYMATIPLVVDGKTPCMLAFSWKFDASLISSNPSNFSPQMLSMKWYQANRQKFAGYEMTNGETYITGSVMAGMSTRSKSTQARFTSGNWYRTTLTFVILDGPSGKTITATAFTADCGKSGAGPGYRMPEFDFTQEVPLPRANDAYVLNAGFSAASEGGVSHVDNLFASPSSAPPVPASPVTLPVSQVANSMIPSTAQNTMPASQGIVLDRYWESPMQGGSQAIEDLGILLSPFGQGTPNTAANPGLPIYGGVTYLMPLKDAKTILNLGEKLSSKNKVLCAGFPKGSLFFYAFDGVFEGHFNKLYLVTDLADQVVSAMLVAETPRRELVEVPNTRSEWHLHNFILSRSKATSRLWINHTSQFQKRGEWREYSAKGSSYNQPEGPVMLLRVDSSLIDPGSRDGQYRQSGWKALEASRLYLPGPMIELILHCVRKR